jgi:serine/threonine-protein kinase HipA
VSPRKTLEVFLHGRHLGTLGGTSIRPELRYDTAIVNEYGAGSVLLSLSLPLSPKKITGPAVYNFFDGLLPEGQVRAHLAHLHGVPTTDVMGLLEALGSDCAGAIQVLPQGQEPPAVAAPLPMTRKEVVSAVESLPTWELPDDFTITTSLGGVQSKILLSQEGNDWSWPAAGAPSTHIIKPDPLDSPVPHLLQAEDWALRLAAASGLPASEAWLETFGERLAIIVARYDRQPGGRRIHQEDFTQALALGSNAKYEGGTAGSSRLSSLVDTAVPHVRDMASFRSALLQYITLNLVIGNGDAHSKNYSLIIRDGGEVLLAPMYDIAPTLLLYSKSRNAGHTVGGQSVLNYITLEHLVREGASWGMKEPDARAAAAGLLEQVNAAASGVPCGQELSFIPELVTLRAQDLLAGKTARRSLPAS